MARLKTELCPICGKGEFIRYPDVALDYHEKCSVCGAELVIPRDTSKPIREYKVAVIIGDEDSWGAIFDGIRSLAAR